MRKHWLVILITLALFCGPGFLYAQEIVKSDVIENFDGKDFYIHSVEQGQTLYSISKAYDVPVDELKYENPVAEQGLSIGQVLRFR